MYMTKEEFKSKKEIINSKINELNNEMVKLKKRVYQIQHKVSYRKQGLYHHPCISIYEFA